MTQAQKQAVTPAQTAVKDWDWEDAPQQLHLFGGGGSDMAKLRGKLFAMSSKKSAATLRAYAADWRDFETWCKHNGKVEMPSTPDTVGLYIVHSVDERKLSLSTVERRLAAISGAHRAANAPSPVTRHVRSALSGYRRDGVPGPQRKDAVTVDQLRAMLKAQPKSAIGVRDRALLLFAFASGMRRSEISALDLSDIAMTEKGIRVQIAKSKTDQLGAGREIGIFRGRRKGTCPWRAMKYWLHVRGKDPGPLFVSCDGQARLTADRLKGDAIYEVLKRSVEAIGLDPSRYGAHSLRAGCVTAAAEAGVPESIIMQRTGHKSIAMVAKYVRPARLWALDPLAKCL